MNNVIAVIIVNYNGLNDTIECIKSVEKSSCDVQIVVVDNASKENEAEKLRSVFPEIKVFHLKTNAGFAGGNNVGIKWALKNGFEYIALLNNDTIVEKNMFELLIKELNSDNVVAPYMFYHDQPTDLWYGGGYINQWTGNSKHLCLKRKDPFECSFVTGCCFLTTRKVWENTGLFDESYFMYNEDTDYSVRLLQKKIKIKIIPQAKLWHKVGKSSGGVKSSFCMYYVTRNRLYCLKKHKSFFKPTAYLFSLITRFLWMLAWKIKGKNWFVFYQAIKDYRTGIMGASYKSS